MRKKNLLDFMQQYPNVDWGRITSAYTSCMGRREMDIYVIYDHVQRCNCCQDWIRNREAIAKMTMASDADRQRVIDRMKILGNEVLAESRVRECEREEAELYLTGGLGI